MLAKSVAVTTPLELAGPVETVVASALELATLAVVSTEVSGTTVLVVPWAADVVAAELSVLTESTALLSLTMVGATEVAITLSLPVVLVALSVTMTDSAELKLVAIVFPTVPWTLVEDTTTSEAAELAEVSSTSAELDDVEMSPLIVVVPWPASVVKVGTTVDGTTDEVDRIAEELAGTTVAEAEADSVAIISPEVLAEADETLSAGPALVPDGAEVCWDVVSCALVAVWAVEVKGAVVAVQGTPSMTLFPLSVSVVWHLSLLVDDTADDTVIPVLVDPGAPGPLLVAAGAPVSLLAALDGVPALLVAEDTSVLTVATIDEPGVALLDGAEVPDPHGPIFTTGCPLEKTVVVQTPPKPPVGIPPGPPVVGAPPEGFCPDGAAEDGPEPLDVLDCPSTTWDVDDAAGPDTTALPDALVVASG